MKLSENSSLKSHNTFGLDEPARYLFEYQSAKELMSFVKSNFLEDKEFYSIGSGSNILFTKPYDGVVLHSQIKGYEVIEESSDSLLLRVGAGEIWDEFVAYCVDNNWCGVENLSNIPGHVGASPVQNIGAYGIEAKDAIDRVIGIDVDNKIVKEFTNKECSFGYRDSIFKHELRNKFIITEVVFSLSKEALYHLDYAQIKEELDKYDAVNLQNIRKAIISIRTSKLPDPLELGNAGSFYKNPLVSTEKFNSLQQKYPQIPYYQASEDKVKVPAAWLIEQAGWKGKSHGNAAVHDKQALVIVNKGNAKGKEIVELSQLIRQSVFSKFDIEIEPEVIFL